MHGIFTLNNANENSLFCRAIELRLRYVLLLKCNDICQNGDYSHIKDISEYHTNRYA